MPVRPIFVITPATGSSSVPGDAGGQAHKVDGVQATQSVPDVPKAHHVARPAKPLADVAEPSAEEVARHSLTHVPYKR